VTIAIATAASGNAKLGDAAATHAAQMSCPDTSWDRIRAIRERVLTTDGREPTVAEVAGETGLNRASVYEWLRYLRGDIIHPAERRRLARQRSTHVE
jgi:hypothetical protein